MVSFKRDVAFPEDFIIALARQPVVEVERVIVKAVPGPGARLGVQVDKNAVLLYQGVKIFKALILVFDMLARARISQNVKLIYEFWVMDWLAQVQRQRPVQSVPINGSMVIAQTAEVLLACFRFRYSSSAFPDLLVTQLTHPQTCRPLETCERARLVDEVDVFEL